MPHRPPILWCSIAILSLAVLRLSAAERVAKSGRPDDYVPASQKLADQSLTDLKADIHAQQTPTHAAARQAVVVHGVTLEGSDQVARTPPSSDNVIVLSSCQEIIQPGHYVLAADFSGGDSCLFIHNTTGVDLDCKGHKVASSAESTPVISVSQVDGFSMAGCDAASSDSYGLSYGVKISESKNVAISGSKIDKILVDRSQGLTVRGNQIAGFFQQNNSSDLMFLDNDVRSPGNRQAVGGVVLSGGHHNQVSGNHIDGGWNGVVNSTLGADDGIVLSNESQDVISGNTISNVYDAGIESTGKIADTTITFNIISMCAYSAILSYYDTSWNNMTVSDNLATDTHYFLVLGYNPRDSSLPGSQAHLDHLTITGNTMRYPTRPPTQTEGAMVFLLDGFPLATSDGTHTLVASDIVVADNDFGPLYYGVQTSPANIFNGAFRDGGNNFCLISPLSAVACKRKLTLIGRGNPPSIHPPKIPDPIDPLLKK